MSSYELFVQDPMRLAESSFFHPFSLTNAPNFDKGVARSGVNGPLIVGSSSDRFWRQDDKISGDESYCEVRIQSQ
jgi:hypothetical protein